MVIMDFCDITEEVQKITVYNNGEAKEYSRGDEFNLIINGWCDLLEGAREMPAFGVSLNEETLAARNSGVWVEYGFDKTLTHNGMSFSKLLVGVQPTYKGFNIVRYNADGGYFGRCFYIDLVNRNMSDFYDILVDL